MFSGLQEGREHPFPTPVFSQMKQCSQLQSHKIFYNFCNPAIFVSCLNSTFIISLFGMILLEFLGYEIIFFTYRFQCLRFFLCYIKHSLTKNNSLNVHQHLCFLGLYSLIFARGLLVGSMLVWRVYIVPGGTVARSVEQEVECASASPLALMQLH